MYFIQKVNLNDHLDKCNDDIDAFIPNENFDGLGVIDYESWRPLWDRFIYIYIK